MDIHISVPPGEVWVYCPVCVTARVRARENSREPLFACGYCATCTREWRLAEAVVPPSMPMLRVRQDAPRKVTCPIRGCDGAVGLRDGGQKPIRSRAWCSGCQNKFLVAVVHDQSRFLTVVGGVNLLVKRDEEIRALD